MSSVVAELVGVQRQQFVDAGAGEVEEHDEGVGAGRPVGGRLDEPGRLLLGHAFGGAVVRVDIGPVDGGERVAVDGLEAGGVGVEAPGGGEGLRLCRLGGRLAVLRRRLGEVLGVGVGERQLPL